MVPVHKKLTGGEETIDIVYRPNTYIRDFGRKVKENRDRDKATLQTNTGPHRDDFSILSDGMDIKTFGSQGQIRSSAISLKLSEINMIKEHTGEYPVLLLDDVMSELDSHRQEYLLEEINKTQTIVTGTGMDEFFEKGIHINKKYFVRQGNVILK